MKLQFTPVERLDKISADITGRFPKSCFNNRYFTILVDKCAQYYKSIPTKTKSSAELGSKIISLIKRVQTTKKQI